MTAVLSSTVNNCHSVGSMHSKGHNTQAVLTILFLAECPEHGLEIGFVLQLSDWVACTQVLLPQCCIQHIRLLHHRKFLATMHVKASINRRFYINAYVSLDILLYEYSWSLLAADPTSRRPSGCVLKNLAFEICENESRSEISSFSK